MKKYLAGLLLGMALVGPRWAYAYSFGDALNDLDNEVKIHYLDNAQASYFYNAVVGRSDAGVNTHVIVIHKYLAGDVGWETPYNDKDRGFVCYGGSILFNKILEDAFPEQVGLFKLAMPGLIKSAWEGLFFGPYIARDTTRDQLVGGYHIGLECKFW